METRSYMPAQPPHNMLSIPLANKMMAGFVPMRKAGKTPGSVVSKSYKKESGETTLELRNDLKPGNVLIVDDVLSTGDSLLTAIELARSAGHTVVDAIVMFDIPPLRQEARKKLKGCPLRVIIAN